ncbi:hypothetical protein HanPI659440_Chr10g0377541 [Helianthus annuus]|nr:hypothetical protein HanPI659440_Chr10g0377541 [Helianthus annuus]
MKEAAYADELKALTEFKGTRNDWFVKDPRKRGKKATPQAQKGEGSSSQPKKRQKKVAKTLLIDEPEVDEPVVNVEEDPYAEIDMMLNVDDLELEQVANIEVQKEKVVDDVEGDDVDKSTTSSSSSSEDEIDENERLKRIQEETEKEKLLRKRKRQEKEDALYEPSPQRVSESQSPPSSGRKKAGARKRIVSPK